VVIALTYVFGIGRSSSAAILAKAQIDPEKRVKDMSEEELDKIRRVIDAEYQTEGNLRSEVRMNIKRLMDIGCYRGLRHRRGLPCHGQRTRTNSRTRKGPRKTIANKKKAPAK
jgi:small subunit ribosomal protein S13